MPISGVTTTSYGTYIPVETRIQNADGSYSSFINKSMYLPKPYEQIVAEQNGDDAWLAAWREGIQAEVDRIGSMTPTQLHIWKTDVLAKQRISPVTPQATLSDEDFSQLSGSYRSDMPKDELDALLVKLVKAGVISDADRKLAFGMKQSPRVMFESGMVMVNYDRDISFEDFHYQGDSYDWLKRLDELLEKQSFALKQDGFDYYELTGQREACKRLMDIFAKLS